MAKAKKHFYLVDNLDTTTGDTISRGLRSVSTITGVTIDSGQGVVEVVATTNPDAHVKMACDVAGAAIRMKMKKRHLY